MQRDGNEAQGAPVRSSAKMRGYLRPSVVWYVGIPYRRRGGGAREGNPPAGGVWWVQMVQGEGCKWVGTAIRSTRCEDDGDFVSTHTINSIVEWY